MTSTKEYQDLVLKQLTPMPGAECRPMMGEFLLYSDGVLFGGTYDDRLLVKIVAKNSKFGMTEMAPYPNGKPIYFVEEVDDREKLMKTVKATIKGAR